LVTLWHEDTTAASGNVALDRTARGGKSRSRESGSATGQPTSAAQLARSVESSPTRMREPETAVAVDDQLYC